MRDRVKKELAAIYQNIRAEERALLDARVREATAKAPELGELSIKRADVMRAVGERRLTAVEGRSILADISLREREALKSAGLPADALTLHVRCKLCNDTGYLDAALDQKCPCQLRYAAALEKDSSINDLETFSNFSEAVYPDEAQKKQALRAKAFCESYAKTLPNPEKPNLILLGTNGLGKSFLSNAIAFDAISRGVDAARVTAYRFTQDILADIRTNSQNAARYQSVPLFVLDDLGSEPVIPNVSNEWLFAIVNERLLKSLATVIATNLDYEALELRYGDRLFSRFVNQRASVTLRLTGRDLRLTKC